MNKLEKVIGDYCGFLDDILHRVSTARFEFTDFIQIDHMCYRTTSLEN